MAKMTIEVEYEVDGDGCENPELELLEFVSDIGSAIIHDNYDIIIHSMAIVKGVQND